MTFDPDKLLAFDTETHLIQPGLLAPPLVVGSIARKQRGTERLLSKEEARREFRAALEDGETHIGGANLVYDLGVMCADDASLLPLVFKALEQGRMHSTDVLEALHDNASGTMFLDQATNRPFARYSLAQLETRYLGIDRSFEKVDGWRLKYATLDNVPLEQWPEEAVAYPRRDARGTHDVLAVQLFCDDRLNTQCEPAEMRAAWFLQLACIWGMRTDPVMVDAVVSRIMQEHKETRRTFFDSGLVSIRPIKKVKKVWERADEEITAEWLQQASIRLHRENAKGPSALWRIELLADIDVALKALKTGRKLRWTECGERIRALVENAYNGSPPLTNGGASGNQKVSISRDTLLESGDSLLEAYGEAGPNEKLLSTYVKVLQQGTKVPINPKVNTLVKTQRTSYREPNLQQIPRKGGIRECFVPRPGSLFCSCDYATLELCALSQVCLFLFGESAMGEAINAGQDLHTRLGGAFMGLDYSEAIELKKKKDPLLLSLRQAAKPVNFGLPGLMGAPKLVATARKDGIRFCELSKESENCADNPRVTEYYRRTIAPTCKVCLRLAENYKDAFYKAWPEVKKYHEFTVAQADKASEGVPVQSFGSGMLRLEASANAVSNHYFQNLAAQGAKHAGWLLAKESYTDKSSPLYGNMRTVVFVHDEAFSEVREEFAHEAATRQAEVMMAGMREFIPDVRVTVEPALMRRWFKGAEAAYSKAGRLKPWWPSDWTWAPDMQQMAVDNSL